MSVTDMLGREFSDRYVIERELGRGGMATVFLARDLRHERPVAVKIMSRDLVSPTGTERFLNEIQFAARLTHPHVLGVHDSGDVDGLPFYVMPYVDGETLRTRLARDGALPLADATRLFRELADALAYAHGRGVVHRDLKPENVLLSGGHAVVADFGIAKAVAAATQQDSVEVSHLTGTGMSVGTPAYMAPEQAVGDRNTDHRADLYALGVIAYEMLAGAHPFGARTAQGFVAAHLTEAPAPLRTRQPAVPAALGALVDQLLAKDPAARPQGAHAVLQALDAASPSAAHTPRRRLRIAFAAAGAMLMVAGASAYVALHRTAPPRSAVIQTVAVLPFVNTGGTTADDYFSDGMTDEVAHALARLPGLRIAGRTSSYQFKGRAVPAQEIGRVLEVGALVEGTVRRAGDRLRVTMQLVGTSDGKVLWESTYESQSNDVFGVQDQFTRAVVAALASTLGNGASAAPVLDVGRGTTDVEAYELYLKGRYYWLARGGENVMRSIDYFHQAIGRDPNFARAHAGLALAYNVLTVYVPDPKDSVSALLAASAERALALDSMLADAQIAGALAQERVKMNFPAAMARYRKAIALEPSNSYAHHSFGFFLVGLGHTDEAVRELTRASQLDPLAKSAGTALALALAFARRGPEAVAASRRVLALDSNFVLAFNVLGLAQIISGQPDSGVRSFQRSMELGPHSPGRLSYLLFAYAAAGRWADAERIRTDLHRPGGDPSGGTDVAFAELIFGDRAPLIDLLTTDAGQRSWYRQYLFGCSPLLDPLWADARFREAMRKLSVEPCKVARAWPVAPRG